MGLVHPESKRLMKCPCGSGMLHQQCCQPLLQRTQLATTAEQLMRARYTAHVLEQVDFVHQTVHPEQRAKHELQTLQAWMDQTTWEGLTIVQTKAGGATDQEGWVWFEAAYRQNDQRGLHREYSYFKREDGQWYFVQGKEPPARRAAPKISRNAPCPCGSGKKYKRCCGAS